MNKALSLRMKPAILTIAFVLHTMLLHSQYYVTTGYNAITPLKFQNFDAIIDVYNNNCPNLNESMEYMNYLQGFTITCGYRYHGVFAEAGYRGGTQKAKASYSDSHDFIVTREMRVRIRCIDLSVGICAPFYEWNFFALGAGVSLGNLSVRTRSNASYSSKPQWSSNLIKDGNVLVSYNLFMRYSPYGGLVCLEPYISVTPKKIFGADMYADLSQVNQNLNPGAAAVDPQELDVLHTHAGLKIIVIIPLGTGE